VHADAEAHEIPLSAPPLPGVGVFWIVQSPPSNRSAKGCSDSDELVQFPTAMQAVGDAHETLASPVWVAPEGVGVVSIVQCPELHIAANPEPVGTLPTATQVVEVGHETACSQALAVDVSGVLCGVQLFPSHRSASGVAPPPPSLESPTAVHAEGPAQDTPVKAPTAGMVT
jgi:hypothetical protein